jgi:hypothetical protein
MARQVITRINGGTKTKAAVFSQPSEQWTPDWDKQAASGQGMARSAKRVRMGTKQTPLGPGKLMKRT